MPLPLKSWSEAVFRYQQPVALPDLDSRVDCDTDSATQLFG